MGFMRKVEKMFDTRSSKYARVSCRNIKIYCLTLWMLHTELVVTDLEATLEGVLLYFSSLKDFFRDAVWHAAKITDFLKNNHLRISEDLSPADREKRMKLWPAVEKARKENKRAFFVGGRAFVDGVEIHPPT